MMQKLLFLPANLIDMITESKADRLGILTSLACAVHCIVFPMVISALPFLGLEFLDNKVVELGLMLIALLAGAAAFRHSYLHHRRKLPACMFVTGCLCLLINQFTRENYLLVLIPSSAILIITAHCLNIRFRIRQKKQHTGKLYAVN